MNFDKFEEGDSVEVRYTQLRTIEGCDNPLFGEVTSVNEAFIEVKCQFVNGFVRVWGDGKVQCQHNRARDWYKVGTNGGVWHH